jgi:hypothetical protein
MTRVQLQTSILPIQNDLVNTMRRIAIAIKIDSESSTTIQLSRNPENSPRIH